MIKLKSNKGIKGIILLIVLGTILIVVIMGNIIMAIMASQSRLTHHEVSRIQAYYAAWAGINYGYEQLRTGNWPTPAPGTEMIPPFNLCDANFPNTIHNNNCPSPNRGVTIHVAGPGSPTCNPPPDTGVQACISANVDYRYQ